ncbi:MAG: penicillin-binding protein 2, partial [Muribaculaceae bacterium]|nr:penicillin-binding protein 2 [Muribaculaceae bacterium]
MRKDYSLEKRKYVIGGFLLLIVAIYLVRLFSLQVADDKYKAFAENNAFLRKIQYPSRGLIYDRNGELVVYNQPAYDVMIIPRDIKGVDTLDFCRTVGITRQQFDERMAEIKRSPGYSAYTPQRLMTHLTARDYGRLQEKLYRYPGFYTQKRILRQYNYLAAANVLGNVREVNKKDIDNDDYYQPGDYTGDLGVEKSYEEYLRGDKGVEILMRDAYGRIQGRYEDGAFDKDPHSGRNLTLSLDIRLQQFAESLMVNKIGAVVAIEPKTGEVLCMVSSPTYDPTLLVGRDRGKNYLKLTANDNEDQTLFDRALMGTYRPGATVAPGREGVGR